MSDTLAIILAGGRGARLSVLSQKRVKPAVPFGGKYRLIDFTLSNCVNSGIYNVGILTQYQPHSLNNHIRTGRPWDLDRQRSGAATLLPPCQRANGASDWYRGTADAVYQNLDFVLRHEVDMVLILSGDHVYKMDYRPLLRYHHDRQADVTICATEVPLERAPQFGIIAANEGGRVVEFYEKPTVPRGTLASMGIYVFSTNALAQRLVQDARRSDSGHDFGADVLPRMLALGDRLHVFPFRDYWMDVGTVAAYWQANMDLLGSDPPFDLADPTWSVYTRGEERPPARVCPGAVVSNSLLSEGCVVEGRVEGSVLAPGVRVWAGALVRDSILLSDCQIGPGAIVERAILDKHVVVGQEARIGVEPGYALHSCYPGEVNGELTLVGKNTRLPPGLRLGGGYAVSSDLVEDDFCPGETRHALTSAKQVKPLLGLFDVDAPSLSARRPLEIQQEHFVVIE